MCVRTQVLCVSVLLCSKDPPILCSKNLHLPTSGFCLQPDVGFGSCYCYGSSVPCWLHCTNEFTTSPTSCFSVSSSVLLKASQLETQFESGLARARWGSISQQSAAKASGQWISSAFPRFISMYVCKYVCMHASIHPFIYLFSGIFFKLYRARLIILHVHWILCSYTQGLKNMEGKWSSVWFFFFL